jgi:hypothetical protein
MTSGERLASVVERVTPQLEAMSEEDAAKPPAVGKWSPKEIIGHLIDSASNNHQRFVRAQFTADLVFPGYEQELWVESQRYASAPWRELIALWRSFNLHLARLMDATPHEIANVSRDPHNLDSIGFRDLPEGQPATLAWFMNDYVDHLEHHLAQVRVD